MNDGYQHRIQWENIFHLSLCKDYYCIDFHSLAGHSIFYSIVQINPPSFIFLPQLMRLCIHVLFINLVLGLACKLGRHFPVVENQMHWLVDKTTKKPIISHHSATASTYHRVSYHGKPGCLFGRLYVNGSSFLSLYCCTWTSNDSLRALLLEVKSLQDSSYPAHVNDNRNWYL